MFISAFRSSLSPAMWLLTLALMILWGGIAFNLQRSQDSQVHYAEASIQLQAQTFAESTRAYIERIDTLLYDVRSDWLDHKSSFADHLRQRQGLVSDITFQISIIDQNGYLAFSNINALSEHVYFGDHEYFKSHVEQGIDKLFISKPFLDPTSQRWLLQFSRPIYEGKRFKGVVLLSLFPESLTNLNERIAFSNHIVTAITDTSGLILARTDANTEIYHLHLKGYPFNTPNGPNKGMYLRVSQIDQINRLFGFVRLPEFELITIISLPYGEVMAPYYEHRNQTIFAGSLISLFLIGIGLLVLRNQKKSERSEQAARASEAMLQASIEATGEGFVIFNEHDRLTFMNDRYRSLYSSTEASMVIGASFEEIIRYGVEHGQYAAAIGREEEWIAERLQSHRNPGSHVIQQLGDGTWLKIGERRTPEGYTVGFRIDITEQVEARQAAEQALQELKQAEKAKTLFLSNISHELRTPLNGIIGMTEVLAHSELTSQQKEILNYLKESGEKLRALIMNLLDFSELQSQTLAIEFAPFNPYETLGSATSKFQSYAASKNLLLKAESQGYVPYSIIGDVTRIIQVLRQLIENAIKFTSVGEIVITMSFSPATEEDKPKLSFSVSDTGLGISYEDQSLIFQPFTQKDGSSTRNQGGTGIGLSLARGIIEKLGGHLYLKSIPGVGSTFSFEVPVTLPS